MAESMLDHPVAPFCGHRSGRHLEGRLIYPCCRLCLIAEQGFNFAEQFFIAGTGLSQEAVGFARFSFHGGVIQPVNLTPPLRIHASSAPCSRRRSQTLTWPKPA